MSDRNYAQEAAQIVAGQSRLIPEKAHLLAMAGQVQSAAMNVETLAKSLAAVMVDNDLVTMTLPKELFDEVAKRQAGIQIERRPDGSIAISRTGLTPEEEIRQKATHPQVQKVQ